MSRFDLTQGKHCSSLPHCQCGLPVGLGNNMPTNPSERGQMKMTYAAEGKLLSLSRHACQLKLVHSRQIANAPASRKPPRVALGQSV